LPAGAVALTVSVSSEEPYMSTVGHAPISGVEQSLAVLSTVSEGSSMLVYRTFE